jgi:hypothetical protein
MRSHPFFLRVVHRSSMTSSASRYRFYFLAAFLLRLVHRFRSDSPLSPLRVSSPFLQKGIMLDKPNMEVISNKWVAAFSPHPKSIGAFFTPRKSIPPPPSYLWTRHCLPIALSRRAL